MCQYEDEMITYNMVDYMYQQVGEWVLCEGVESLQGWEVACNENGYEPRRIDGESPDGVIYGQNGSVVYGLAPYDSETGEIETECETFHAVLVESDEED